MNTRVRYFPPQIDQTWLNHALFDRYPGHKTTATSRALVEKLSEEYIKLWRLYLSFPERRVVAPGPILRCIGCTMTTGSVILTTAWNTSIVLWPKSSAGKAELMSAEPLTLFGHTRIFIAKIRLNLGVILSLNTTLVDQV